MRARGKKSSHGTKYRLKTAWTINHSDLSNQK